MADFCNKCEAHLFGDEEFTKYSEGECILCEGCGKVVVGDNLND